MADDKAGGLNLTECFSSYPSLVEVKTKSSAHSTPICYGDAVVEDSAGQVETGDSITPGESFYSGVSLNFGEANKETRQYVIVNPTALFDTLVNTDDSSFGTRHKGQYINLDIQDGIERQSRHRLDAPTVAAYEERDVLIIGPSILGIEMDRPRILITFSRHRYANNRVKVTLPSRNAGRPPLFSDKQAFDKAMRIAFSLADGVDQNHIAYEIDRLINKGSGKFGTRQLRKQCDDHYPGLCWSEIVAIFSP